MYELLPEETEPACVRCGSESDVEEVSVCECSTRPYCPSCLAGWQDGNQNLRLWRRLRSARMRALQRAGRDERKRRERDKDDRYFADVLQMFADSDREQAMVSAIFQQEVTQEVGAA
jgi:hypothetical protein